MKYGSKTRYEALHAVRNGATLREAEKITGAGHETVRRWCISEGISFLAGCRGGAIVAKRQQEHGKPAKLKLEQRLAIAYGLAAKRTHEELAHGIGFSRSTASRELARHRERDGTYDPYAAQMRAERDATRPKVRKLDANERLRAYVVTKLALRWSPAQISAQLTLDLPEDEVMRVSHEAIYQALYVQGKGALRQELKLEKALRSGRRAHLPQSRLAAKRGQDKSWVEGCELAKRPPEAEDRGVSGHWEGDLIIGGNHKSCLVTLVERTTRFVLVRRLEMHPTDLVTHELAGMVRDIPDALVRTITWDQGMEMARHADFTAKTGVKVYFCDPHSPWQQETNENTNGLIRDYFPRDTDFSKVTDEEVCEMQDQLNGRPRQTLGWRKPVEAYAELLSNVA